MHFFKLCHCRPFSEHALLSKVTMTPVIGCFALTHIVGSRGVIFLSLQANIRNIFFNQKYQQHPEVCVLGLCAYGRRGQIRIYFF
jgi:hypothetical protein